MINRAAVILKYKDPFVKWLNATDPYDENPGISLAEANDDGTVYLIRDEDGENLEDWLALNYKTLFENELEDWYTDESLWPKKRTKKKFHEWFEVACHTAIYDTVGAPIVEDES
jgi:hypothetical protein